MDKLTRNAIERATQQARKLLGDDFSSQLEGTFDVQWSGVIAPTGGVHLSVHQHFQRGKIVAAIEHKRAAGLTAQDAVIDYVRDAAFTTLNRYIALKMLEERELVQECITKGEQSSGYREFCGMAPGIALLPEALGYRLYIECLFDEFSTEIKVLFDRRDAASVMWPKRQTFEALLAILNAADLSGIWGNDETIGWVYQFFNSNEERRKMRDESQAPRNSRELAVRNQFFTPRYVVQFLVDNTLGRIWSEMYGAQTLLSKFCEFLVCAADEPFKLRQRKDPRDFRILDPACGSGHFLLYSFDLLLIIYKEAWLSEKPTLTSEVTGNSLREDYPDLIDLQLSVPRLIVEHNLYGVDIDPRCTQIAALALWLRAQRAWKDMGIHSSARPRIQRTHIVVAEPIPGDAALVDEVAACLDPPLLRDLFKMMVRESSLAGDLGVLLRTESGIASELKRAREQFVIQRQTTGYLPGMEPKTRQGTLDLSGIDDDHFFYEAEARILEALRDVSEAASSSSNVRRQLFAGDAAQGIALIDIVRTKYDVVLMNPPFGYPSEPSKTYVDGNYPSARYDVLAAFIDRAFELLSPEGYLGCISSRTVFFIEFFAEWRRCLFKNRGLEIFTDLGFGVLDALVETAAFTIRNSPVESAATFIRLLSSSEKDNALRSAIHNIATGEPSATVFSEIVTDFLSIDGCPMAYWVAKSFRDHFFNHKSVKTAVGEVRVGLQTGDDFRFIRTAWEVDSKKKGTYAKWVPLAKGGEYRKFYDDIHLLVNWDSSGSEIIHLLDEKGKQRSRPQNISCYYRPGLTYPMRTTSNYSPRLLPADCIFNVQGNSVFEVNDNQSRLLASLAVLSTATFESFTRLKARVGDMTTAGGAGFAYTPGLVGSMPFPEISSELESVLSKLVTICIVAERSKDTTNEPSTMFVKPILASIDSSLRSSFEIWLKKNEDMDVASLEASRAIEEFVQVAYGLSAADILEVHGQFGQPVAVFTNVAPIDTSVIERLYRTGVTIGEEHSTQASQQRQLSSDRHLRIDEICRVAHISPRLFVTMRQEAGWIRDDELVDKVSDLVSYGVGVVFGRWDIRFATGDASDPQLPGLFATLPVCSPGQLQNEEGLPATIDDIETVVESSRANYPSDIAWGGILVDDPGHFLDIERRLEQVLQVIWKDRYEAAIHEACEILSVGSLREYLRKPTGFFGKHLKRYSKSRRQAPIYWPLSTPSGSYTIWLYYHRLSRDTLYQAATLVKEKLGHEERLLEGMATGTNLSLIERKERAAQVSLVSEIRAFHDEVSRIAPLWCSNLDDGAALNFAPLWRMIMHRPWQASVRETWDELCAGKYDWAHLAMHLWPERVVPKCAIDCSLATAHGLLDLFWVEDGNKKLKPRQIHARPIEQIVNERTSIAVKDALKELMESSAPNGTKTKSRRSSL